MAIKIRDRGFTLIELLIAMAITLVLTGGAITSFNTFNDNQLAKQAAVNLRADLRKARNRAISGEKPLSGCTTLTNYNFSNNITNYSVQPTCNPEGLAGTKITVTLPKNVTLQNLYNFSFSALTGRVDWKQATGIGPFGVTIYTVEPVTIVLVGLHTTYSIIIDPNGDINGVGF